MADPERIEILSERELGLTLSRLASQVLESAEDSRRLMLLGIPTRGVQLSRVLARELERLTGHAISQGAIDPTFHRDDLERIGTRLPQLTTLPTSIEDRQVILVDDVIFTGRTVRAALEAMQSWGRPQRVMLLAMVDRGHRELPIQPDFCGRVVPTRRSETIELRLRDVDGEEGCSSADSAGRLEFVGAEMGLVAAEGNDHRKRWADHPTLPIIENVRHLSGLPFHVKGLAPVFGMVEHNDGCLHRHPVARLHCT